MYLFPCAPAAGAGCFKHASEVQARLEEVHAIQPHFAIDIAGHLFTLLGEAVNGGGKMHFQVCVRVCECVCECVCVCVCECVCECVCVCVCVCV